MSAWLTRLFHYFIRKSLFLNTSYAQVLCFSASLTAHFVAPKPACQYLSAKRKAAAQIWYTKYPMRHLTSQAVWGIFAAPHKRTFLTGADDMMTEATLNVVTLLALIAIVHFAVTAIIARKLTSDELASEAAEAAEKIRSVKFNRTAANDGFRNAA